MPDVTRILRSITHSVTGIGFFGFSQWVTLIVMAKLEPAGGAGTITGQYLIALAVTTPLFMLTNCNLRLFITTDANTGYTDTQYLRARLYSSALASFLSIAALYTLTRLSEWNTSLLLVAGLVTCIKFFENICDVIYGMYQRRETLIHLRNSFGLRGLVYIGASTLTYLLDKNLYFLLLTILVGTVMVVIFFDMIIIDIDIGERVDNQTIINIAGDTYLLGLAGAVVALNIAIPRLWVENKLGLQVAGIFGTLLYVTRGGHFLLSSVAIVFLPKLSKFRKNGERKKFFQLHYLMLTIILMTGLCLLVFVYFFGSDIITIMFSPDYAKEHETLFYLCVAFVFTALTFYLQNSLTIMRSFAAQIKFGLTTTSLLIVLTPLFINVYGIIGAAYALIIARVIQFLFIAAISERLFRSQRFFSPEMIKP